MKYISILIYVLFIVIITSCNLSAGCFHAKPLPNCNNFWATEAHVMYRLDNNGLGKWHERGVYRFVVGRMFNINNGYAYGGSMSINIDELSNKGKFYLGGRVRKWLSPKVAIDATIALPLSTNMFSFSRLLLSVSASKDDYFGVTVAMEQVKIGAVSDTRWSAGVRFGSELGIIASVFAILHIANLID